MTAALATSACAVTVPLSPSATNGSGLPSTIVSPSGASPNVEGSEVAPRPTGGRLSSDLWFRLVQQTGTRGIQAIRVIAGTLAGDTRLDHTYRLPSEPTNSDVAGGEPFVAAVGRERFLFAYFDGSTAHLAVASAGDGSIAEATASPGIVHHATVTQDGTTAYAVLVDPRSRQSTGIYRVSLRTGAADKISSIDADAPRGFVERLYLTPDQTRLVSWRCKTRCRLWVRDLPTGVERVLAPDEPFGDIAGITDREFIVSDQDCGTSCGWRAFDLGDGTQTGIGTHVDVGIVVADASGFVLVYDTVPSRVGISYELHAIDLETRGERVVLRAKSPDVTLVPLGDDYAMSLEPGTVVLGPDGQLSGAARRRDDPTVAKPRLLALDGSGDQIPVADLGP